MDNMFDRTIGLLGEESFKLIQEKTVAIFGLGGVGGTAFEALLRTGFRKFVICDFDKVDPSNLNRQILYTKQDIGLPKVDCAKKRAVSINPDIEVNTIEAKVGEDLIPLLGIYDIDFIVDAIDDVSAKVVLAKYAQEKQIPFVMSLGMACRMDPSKVMVTKLNKTTNDPLAKKLRYEMKKVNIDTSKINVVFSNEPRLTEGVKLNSTIFTPSSAGLNIASFVVSSFIYK